MTEKNEKTSQKKHGAGKFFLGAVLGAAAGAIASKFIKIDFTSDDEAEKSKTKSCKCDDDCKCDKDVKCDCDKKKVAEKKTTEKKTTAENKPASEKK
jgi:hypothetical protein